MKHPLAPSAVVRGFLMVCGAALLFLAACIAGILRTK